MRRAGRTVDTTPSFPGIMIAGACRFWSLTPMPSRELTTPDSLQELDDLIESSREILALQPGWDGEDASSVEESTWERATEFLRRNASILWTKYGRGIESPTLVPVADGSIDLHWNLASHELLINIPPGESQWADYYGDNRQGGSIVKGTLDTKAANHWLFVWLCE